MARPAWVVARVSYEYDDEWYYRSGHGEAFDQATRVYFNKEDAEEACKKLTLEECKRTDFEYFDIPTDEEFDLDWTDTKKFEWLEENLIELFVVIPTEVEDG